MKSSIKFTSILFSLLFFGASVQVANAQCGVPTGMNATAFSGEKMILSWNPVNGASSYKVQISNAGTGAPAYFYEANVTGTMIEAKGLTAGGNYKFRVKARCSEPMSAWSPYAAFVAT